MAGARASRAAEPRNEQRNGAQRDHERRKGRHERADQVPVPKSVPGAEPRTSRYGRNQAATKALFDHERRREPDHACDERHLDETVAVERGAEVLPEQLQTMCVDGRIDVNVAQAPVMPQRDGGQRRHHGEREHEGRPAASRKSVADRRRGEEEQVRRVEGDCEAGEEACERRLHAVGRVEAADREVRGDEHAIVPGSAAVTDQAESLRHQFLLVRLAITRHWIARSRRTE